MTQAPGTPFTNPAQTWNARFAKEDYVFGTEPNEWLRGHAGVIQSGARLLSVADGEGRNSVWLAKQGHLVDAFDISEVGVSKARKLAERNQVRVNFSVAGCDDFGWEPAQYDAIVAIFVQFADPELRSRLFARMVQSLKPGGTLLLQGYTPKQLEYRTGGPGLVSHLYTPELLREAFGELDIHSLEEYEADLNEGDGHRGRSAVIGLVAVRRPFEG